MISTFHISVPLNLFSLVPLHWFQSKFQKIPQKTQRLFSTQTINIDSFGGCCPHTSYSLYAIQPIYFARLPQALFATK